MDHREIIARVLAIADASEGPVRIDLIAQRIGIPNRTLRYIFAKHYGTSPRRYLIHRRMESARSALLKAQPSENVTTIAMEHGFYELGRFSAHYRQHYGEVPSATLLRATQ